MRQSFSSVACRRGAILSALGLVPALLIGSTLFATHRAHAERADDVLTLQRTYKTGDVDRFKIDFKATASLPGLGDNVPVGLKLVMKETTKDVKPEGNGVLFIQYESAFITLGDNVNDFTVFLATSTQTRSRTGAVLEAKSDSDVKGPAAAISQIVQSLSDGERGFYPPNPVKVGDTWKIEEKTGKPGEPSVSTTGTGTLTGMEMVGDTKTAVIKTVTDMTVINIQDPQVGAKSDAEIPKEVKVHFEATGNIDMTTGKIIRTVGSLSGNGGKLFKGDMKTALATGKDADKTNAPAKTDTKK